MEKKGDHDLYSLNYKSKMPTVESKQEIDEEEEDTHINLKGESPNFSKICGEYSDNLLGEKRGLLEEELTFTLKLEDESYNKNNDCVIDLDVNSESYTDAVVLENKDGQRVFKHKNPDSNQIFEAINQNNLNQHLTLDHDVEGEVFKCLYCNYQTYLQFLLLDHMKVHQGRNEIHNDYSNLHETSLNASFGNDVISKHNDLVDIDEYSNPYETTSNTPFGSYNRSKLDQPRARKEYKCDECEYRSLWRQNLRIHKLKHDKTAVVFNCNSCKYKTKVKRNLKKHIMYSHSIHCEKFKCPHCSFETKMKSNLKNHITKKHEKNPKIFSCDKCKYISNCVYSLKKHIEVVHSLFKYRCDKCAYNTKGKENLKRHISSKHEDNLGVRKCRKCEYKTDSNLILRQHMKKSHCKMYSCKHCDYACKDERNLKTHITVSHDAFAEMFRCFFCDFTTKIVKKLSTHIRLKHDNNSFTYKCPHCDYSSKLKTNLTSHIEYHHNTGIGYKCSECSYQSKVRRNLYKHRRSKHSDVNLECPECQRILHSNTALARHMSVKHNKRENKNSTS